MLEINPFDILSGKVAQSKKGTFWFKEAGNNMRSYGVPIYSNLHRENNLPAAIWNDGDVWWHVNGLPHRTDGPAFILKSGISNWYIDGIEYYTEEEFNKALNEYRNKSI